MNSNGGKVTRSSAKNDRNEIYTEVKVFAAFFEARSDDRALGGSSRALPKQLRPPCSGEHLARNPLGR